MLLISLVAVGALPCFVSVCNHLIFANGKYFDLVSCRIDSLIQFLRDKDNNNFENQNTAKHGKKIKLLP